jgi:hypothetical protein|tara:strand:- start:52 stop:468 length:417 start_codon:yes stop_codon:yes gene_type:complete
MGLFDMAKKLIGSIPVIGPIVEFGTSFIDMLPDNKGSKDGTGKFGKTFAAGSAPFKPIQFGREPEIGGSEIGSSRVQKFGPSLAQYRQYMGRFKSADDIDRIARGKAGNVVAGRVGGRVGSVRGGTPARTASSRTLKA